MVADVYALPPDLPVPVDDGACDHLDGSTVPAVRLRSSNGGSVDLASLRGALVLYVYPRIAASDQHLPIGWDAIAGARGCTAQSCRFRDLATEFRSLGIQLFGLSTQSPLHQRDAVARLHLPFELLSDEQLELTHGWALPTFSVSGDVLLKRFTLVIRDGIVRRVFYPVFPPTTNADDVLRWLKVETFGVS